MTTTEAEARLRDCWATIQSHLEPADAERLRTLPIEQVVGLLAQAYARDQIEWEDRRALRNELSHTVDHLRKMLEKVAGSSGVMLRVDQDAARIRARRAEALLKEIDNR